MAERKFGAIDWGKITENIAERELKGSREVDARIFTPKRGEDGNAEYKLRFIPPKDLADLGVPYAKWFSHSVEMNGKKLYLPFCPSTIGLKCPVCQEYLENWSADKEYAKLFKRKTIIISNFIMIKDPQEEKNNGKIFLLKYGVQIHEKILNAIKPPQGSVDDPIQVYDPYEGANFKFKIKTKKFNNADVPNYEDSSFEGKSELPEELIEKAMTEAYPLGEFVLREKFNILDEVTEKFNVFMNKSSKTTISMNSTSSETSKEETKSETRTEEPKHEESKKEEIKTETHKEEPKQEEPPKTSSTPLNLEDDDDAFWAKVRNKK